MFKHVVTGLAVVGLAASQAHAQYRDDSRIGRTSDKIARTVEEAARAVGAVTDAFDRSLYEVRYRGAERFAIDACRPQVERYGRMRVDDVRPYKKRSIRVYGITEGYRGGYYDSRMSRTYGPRSYTCTVNSDGQIKVKTKKLRRY